VSEVEDAKLVLQMLVDYPSKLGKKELARLQNAALRLIADRNADHEQIAQIIKKLRDGRRTGKGRKLGSIARETKASDGLVLQEIANGATVEKAITKIYGVEGFEAHERRIKRRKREVKFVNSRRGDIK
jgi:hypothetical protein